MCYQSGKPENQAEKPLCSLTTENNLLEYIVAVQFTKKTLQVM